MSMIGGYDLANDEPVENPDQRIRRLEAERIAGLSVENKALKLEVKRLQKVIDYFHSRDEALGEKS